MENRFDNKDFERFVKQNADQYRMFPSEKVWKGIHNTLHTRNRWYGIGLSLLILSTAVVSWVMFSSTNRNKPVISSLPAVTEIKESSEQKAPAPLAFIPREINAKNSFVSSSKEFEETFYNDDYVSVETVRPVSAVAEVKPDMISIQDIVATFTETPVDYPVVKAATVPRRAVQPKQVIVSSVPENKTIELPAPVIADSNPEIPAAIASEEKPKEYSSPVPYTIESVINSYKHIRRKSKISIEAFITPTISYRELKEDKPFVASARSATLVPNASYAADVNTVVTHKPDLGLQAGFTAGLPINQRVKVIAGFQFNVNKYDIKAYDHTPELTPIALSTAAGGTNTYFVQSNYRNVAVNSKENWLKNLYFSASVPIGLEVRLAGNRKSYFGIAATAQPTYLLGNDAYLISTDYKNYAEVPALTRKWNLNAGFSMFAGVSTGHLRWRVGPQVRYQAMSSFKEKYPIQEHLFDFGLKMGIMLK